VGESMWRCGVGLPRLGLGLLVDGAGVWRGCAACTPLSVSVPEVQVRYRFRHLKTKDEWRRKEVARGEISRVLRKAVNEWHMPFPQGPAVLDQTVPDHVLPAFFRKQEARALVSRGYPRYRLPGGPTSPRAVSPTRVNDRCVETGHFGAYRKFKLGRHAVRKALRAGLLPGVTKATWG